jgi:hypothetical protein
MNTGNNMSEAYIEELKAHSQMLGRITYFVEDYAKSEEDSVLLCVLRALRENHILKADELTMWIDREEKLSEPIK